MRSQNEQQAAYDRGFRAHMSGANQADNPYPPGSNDACDWLSGWMDRDHHMRTRDECIEW